MMENQIQPKKLGKLELLLSVLISLFAVVFLRGFRTRGVISLGFNFTIFLLLILAWFVIIAKGNKKFVLKNLFRMIPIVLIAVSFSIFENPWLKISSLIVLPICTSLFFYNTLMKNSGSKMRNFEFLGKVIAKSFNFLNELFDGWKTFFQFLIPAKNDNTKAVIKKTLLGIVILLVVSVIIISLLAAADSDFANMMGDIGNFIVENISKTTLMKIIVFVLIGIVIVSKAIVMRSPFDVKIKEKNLKMDPIVSGIVIGGVLILYMLFILLQIKKLRVGTLPIDFSQTESFVKSGFWQLFALSIINGIFFFLYYKNTNKFVQKILLSFSIASIVLLLSAGQRMFLYVKFYGLSYEKFFASYTMVYCIILFVSLIVFMFRKGKVNIFRYLVVLFLRMYSLATIAPVEQIIFNTNVKLAQNEDSRIDLNELKMLTNDVLNTVVKNKEKIGLDDSWNKWIRNTEERSFYKKFYEKNLVNLLEINYK